MNRPEPLQWDDRAAHQIRFHNYTGDGHSRIGVSCVCLTRMAKGTGMHARALGYPPTMVEAIALYVDHVRLSDMADKGHPGKRGE
jgi:hypothetical protein